MSTSAVTLDGVIADYFAGVNAFDTDAIVATFADDALVNDVRRSSGAGRRSGTGCARRSSATASPSSRSR